MQPQWPQWQPCRISINAFIVSYERIHDKRPSPNEVLDYAGVEDTPQNRQILKRILICYSF